jgi:hypothetical protein
MNKEDAMKLLREKGFDPKYEDDTIMIVTDDGKDVDRMSRILKKAGYRESYGWRLKQQKEDENSKDVQTV